MRILLTGASGGIGTALATAFADAGHTLVLQGRDERRLGQLRESLANVDCVTVDADLTVHGDRQRVLDAAKTHGIDTLCNTAGINQFGAFAACDVARLIEVNVTATLLLTQALLPHLLEQASPRVVVIGSAFGAIGFPGYAAYCASKFALRGFAESLSREFADTALRVHYISPRATATSMNDARVTALNEELGTNTDTPDTVAAHVLRTLARDRRRRQIGAPEALQSSLNAIAPSIVDRALRSRLPTIKRYFEEVDHA